jgi:hypothetical protein
MNNIVKTVGPDTRPITTFPLPHFHFNFAAIIIVIVAAAVAAAAKHFLKAETPFIGRRWKLSGILAGISSALRLRIKEAVGIKPASVIGIVRALPVAMSGHAR